MIRYDMLPTRCGDLLVAIDERGLVHVDFVAGLRPLPDMSDWRQDGEALAPFLAEFRDYFAGRLRRFTLPLAARGTAFQQAVWQALCDIPYGETRSYGDIARALNTPAQAIGQACGANPLPILIPCHRVLGAKGLGGFSAKGGVETKVWLLRHEGAAGLLI